MKNVFDVEICYENCPQDIITEKNPHESKKIHEETNITIIFVIHINEAVPLGNKALIINNGNIEQCEIAEKIKKESATDFI